VEEKAKSNELLTVKEVARILKISPFTLRRWVIKGKIQVVRSGRKIIRFEPDTLARWIRLNRY
jgi:excisionase family DNA binding protein